MRKSPQHHEGHEAAAALESGHQPRRPLPGSNPDVWGEWLSRFRWHHFVTLATDGSASFTPAALARAFDGWIAALTTRLASSDVTPTVCWFRAVEGTGTDGRSHVHALIFGTAALGVRTMSQAWRHGHAKVTTYDATRGAAWYCTKELRLAADDDYAISDQMPPLVETSRKALPVLPVAGRAQTRLMAVWRSRADELAPYAAPAAEAFRTAARELEGELRACDDAVTLSEASRLGGYSIDHLQRLVAQGTLENVGLKGRPRIRRADVPQKPGYSLRRQPSADQLSARRRIVASVSTVHRETK